MGLEGGLVIIKLLGQLSDFIFDNFDFSVDFSTLRINNGLHLFLFLGSHILEFVDLCLNAGYFLVQLCLLVFVFEINHLRFFLLDEQFFQDLFMSYYSADYLLDLIVLDGIGQVLLQLTDFCDHVLLLLHRQLDI